MRLFTTAQTSIGIPPTLVGMSLKLRLNTILLLALSAACSRVSAVDVEKIPLGSEVAVTKEDGGVVQGKLSQRDATAVKVDIGPSVRTVPRETISDVRVVTETAPVVLPPVAKFREFTVPEGTVLHVRLDTGVGSATSKVDEPVEGALTQALIVNGTTLAPIGSRVKGEVTSAVPSPKRGQASLAFQFRTLAITGHDEPYTIVAGISRVAPSEKKDDAITIGAPAVVGAVVGGIIGGKKGAVIGGVVGGGAGTAIVLTSTGKDISLPAGTEVTMALKAPVDIRVPISKG